MDKQQRREEIIRLVEEKKQKYIDLSDAVWRNPELGMIEHKSSKLLIDALIEEGFEMEVGIDEMPTAFIASYGSGKPVIGLLAEFDALPGLSQKAGVAEPIPLVKGGPGHGCGHNALGAAVLAAGTAVKDYLEQHPQSGTVRVYGCPGEESGWSKMFLARDGYFKDVDACFTWHPGNCNSVEGYGHTANICTYFDFHGKSAHAAAAPHLGRSAVDACELMNVGVNYLREHVIPEARMHYAYMNAGGKAPNVVHAEASLKYYIRAPRMEQASAVLERVKDVARGAALMTGTKVDIRVTAAMSDVLVNDVLSNLAWEAFDQVGAPAFDEKDEELAQKIRDILTENEKNAGMRRVQLSYPNPEDYRDVTLIKDIAPYFRTEGRMPGSTDVGDVSYVTPTVLFWITCYANGTPGHSWQVTSQVGSSITHKALVCAAKAMALSTIMSFDDPERLKQAREELNRRTGGKYICPVPPEQKAIIPE